MTKEQELKRLIAELKIIRSNARGPSTKRALTEAIAALRSAIDKGDPK